MCLGGNLFGFIFCGTLCFLKLNSCFFPRSGNFSAVNSSNKFGAPFSFCVPYGIPIMRRLAHLMSYKYLKLFFFFYSFFFPFLWLDKSHFSVFYLLSLYSILSSLLLNPSVRFSVLLLYSSLLWFLFSTFWPSLSLEILTLFMYCSSELGKHLFGHYFEHLSGKSLISISLRPLSSQTLSCSFI